MATINLGNGTTTVYGTMNTLNLSATYYGDTLTGYSFNTSGNNITGTNGNYTVYGTMYDLDLMASGDGIIGGTNGTGNTFVLTGNTISVGNGADTIYGALHDIDLTANYGGIVGGDYNGDDVFSLSGNSIKTGNGPDTVYGTMDNLTLTVNKAFVGGIHGNADYNSFAMYGNTITVGNGSDTVYGTLHDLNMTASVGGIGDGGLNIFYIGNNTITAGNGVDTIYGSMHDINLSANDGFIGTNSIIFGTLDNNTPTNVDPYGNSITVGNHNDTVYGTMHDLTITATNYSYIGFGQTPSSNSFTFENNTITSSSGNDNLYADMHDLVLSADSSSVIRGTTISFGTNVLNVGTGNDMVVGELYQINDNSINALIPNTSIVNVETIANFLANNQVIAGQNTFNLHGYTAANPVPSGTGVDTLVFDPAINIGQNNVNGFVGATDVLQFNNILPSGSETSPSIADLANLIQSISSDGHGGTLVTFNPIINDAAVNANGTIDFSVINHSAAASTTAASITSDLLNLVHNQATHIVIV